MPPPGMMPTVAMFLVVLAALPEAEKPPTVSAPWASVYTLPSTPLRAVCSSTPPMRDEASPTEETVTSIFVPGLAETGIRAVTMTEATFLIFRAEASTPTPMRSIMFFMELKVKTESFLSPVPARPTTSP